MPRGWPPQDLPLLAPGLILAAAFVVLWANQLRTRNATSVDVAWSAAIGLLGLFWAGVGAGAAPQRWLAAALVAAWSGRLTWHLLTDRLLRHRGEDGRYRAMREHFGDRAAVHFFWFYQLQALVAFVFAVPFAALAGHTDPTISALQWTGVTVFVLAQVGEATADRQLAAHRAEPAARGLTCRRGLWRYSRHPNYFFEWLSWCGIGAAAWPAAGPLALLQPALMFVLVRFVSGVPFAEQQSLRSRGDDYRRYQQQTNTFVPWFPR
ncbi:MAG: DUF1295 domain-containing protein [Planctomycetes bacterium]|nr:DUF1295 domain-containing protein [Planctomycetota bacterium]MCB9886757.1 DUF1295 domain-containing protein [Planctomycetota bacterium]